MKKRYCRISLAAMILWMSLSTSACTMKYTQINVTNGEGSQEIDLDGTTVNTETDQTADGQLDSNMDM